MTICTLGKLALLGGVTNGLMVPNHAGRIVVMCWLKLPISFPGISLDAWVLMPNHLHGIVRINGSEVKDNSAGQGSTERNVTADTEPLHHKPHGAASGSLGALIGNFKSVSTRRINDVNGNSSNHLWQRNYHDHIIRSDAELFAIRTYIVNNPANWELDDENPFLQR
ncbi:MAG: transposase [Anaerolineae bacterium]